jgi:hypothetical protein
MQGHNNKLLLGSDDSGHKASDELEYRELD